MAPSLNGSAVTAVFFRFTGIRFCLVCKLAKSKNTLICPLKSVTLYKVSDASKSSPTVKPQP